MMTIVETAAELKAAIAAGAGEIAIADETLARRVRVMKSASKAVLVTAVAAAGALAVAWWNPLGWAAAVPLGAIEAGGLVTAFAVGGAGAVAGEGLLVGAVAFLVASLGVAVIWAIFNDYDLAGSGELSAPSGHKVKGELKLKKKKKRSAAA